VKQVLSLLSDQLPSVEVELVRAIRPAAANAAAQASNRIPTPSNA
jgi:hypothetical protein